MDLSKLPIVDEVTPPKTRGIGGRGPAESAPESAGGAWQAPVLVRRRIVFFANTDWYLYNFRLSLARYLRDQHGAEVIMVSPQGPYGQRLRQAGFQWHPLDMERRSLGVVNAARAIWQLAALLRTVKPDIVHNFTIKSAVFGTLAARLAGVRRVVNAITGLGYVFTGDGIKVKLLRPVVSAIMRRVLASRRSEVVVQNVDDYQEMVEGRFVNRSHLHLIRSSGVDVNRFVPRGQRNFNGPIKVLFIGRLLVDKGIREFLSAASEVRRRRADVEFIVAGQVDEGNPTALTRAEIEAWQMRGVVRFLGHVDAIDSLLNDVQMVVLPSYREGVPRSLIEAAACGLPLIATDVPGCREVVHPEENGLLVPARDASALAQAIDRLLRNRQLMQAMGARSREIAVSEFADVRVFKQTLQVYEVTSAAQAERNMVLGRMNSEGGQDRGISQMHGAPGAAAGRVQIE